MFFVCLGFLVDVLVSIGNHKSIAATQCPVTVSRSAYCSLASHCTVPTFCSGWTASCCKSIHIRNDRRFGEVRELHDRFVEDRNINVFHIKFRNTGRCYCYWKTNYEVSSQVTKSNGNLKVQEKERCTCKIQARKHSSWMRTTHFSPGGGQTPPMQIPRWMQIPLV